MKKNETTQFSWPGLFIVTSFCFFVFSGLIKLINGSSTHSTLFFKTGIASFVLYALAYVADLSIKREAKKKRKPSNPYRNKIIDY
jgi:hypothetical protein